MKTSKKIYSKDRSFYICVEEDKNEDLSKNAHYQIRLYDSTDDILRNSLFFDKKIMKELGKVYNDFVEKHKIK